MAPIFTGGRMGFGRVDAPSGPGAIPLTATGGSVLNGITDSGYKYHVFTVDTPAPQSSFVVTSSSGNIQLLVVGGGGGIQNDNGGGAGGGGIAYASNLPVSPGTYSLTVGSGGSPNPNNSDANSRGTNSTFTHPVGTITGLGGAGPAAQNPGPGYTVITPSLALIIVPPFAPDDIP